MKSVVLSHGDVDGITSGAIALLAFPGSEFYFTRPSNIHADLYRIAKDRPEIVSISDIAINEKRFKEIQRALSKFPSSTKIYWTDHHPMSSKHRKVLGGQRCCRPDCEKLFQGLWEGSRTILFLG